MFKILLELSPFRWMPLTGSLLFVYICIDVGDPVEGRCWDAINR